MRKKRSRALKTSTTANKVDPVETNKLKDEQKIIEGLMSAFESVTLEEAVAAYKLADGDENKAAEILMDSLSEGFSAVENQSTTSCSSTGNFASTSSSGNGSLVDSEVFAPADFVQNGAGFKKGKSKKVIAAAGTVSSMLGKEYVRSTPKKRSNKSKENSEENWREEAEQFLYSMLGADCELSMDVVRDVFCQCAYDVEKALNVLLSLSSSSDDPPTVHDNWCNKEDDLSFLGMSNNLMDSASDSTPHSSVSDSSDNFWDFGPLTRINLNTMAGTEASRRTEQSKTEISQKVLESLFKMPTPSCAEHDPKTMNWKNIVKKLSSLPKSCETRQEDGASAEYYSARGDEYQVYRQASKQHWESMKFCYQKAATAFSNGDRSYAAYLSEQGRQHSKIAEEADEKASRNIFHVRNKSIENLITIDLHGQHVKQAMKLLKLHLMFGVSVRSVRSFRVITGCGSHGLGKSKLKQSVTDLLKREGIECREENSGTLFVRLNSQTEFSFMNSDSDMD